jgi:hypothetical protein
LPSTRLKLIFKFLIFVCLIIAGNYLSQWVLDSLNFEITPVNEFKVHRIIIISMIAYIVLMTIPFVPGAEIGLGFMMILGPKIAPLIYLCTLVSLFLGFMIGRFIPEKNIIKFLQDIRLRKASRLMTELDGLNSQQRFDFLLERSPKVFLPFLLKYRYLALLVIINIPGNIVIGGGGGIAMSAGMSRLFTPTRYLLTIAIAVAPIPLFLLVFGENLADWPV